MSSPEEKTTSGNSVEIHERYLDLLNQGLGVDEARGMIAQQLAAELYYDEEQRRRERDAAAKHERDRNVLLRPEIVKYDIHEYLAMHRQVPQQSQRSEGSTSESEPVE